ncbi:hypothetical protein ACG9XQ_18060, partial [Acinetobacter baumannii]
TCEQIKRDVIAAKAGDALGTALLGSVSVGDAKPDQIETTFRALSAVKGTHPSNPGGDALHKQQNIQAGDGKPEAGEPKPNNKKEAWKQSF